MLETWKYVSSTVHQNGVGNVRGNTITDCNVMRTRLVYYSYNYSYNCKYSYLFTQTLYVVIILCKPMSTIADRVQVLALIMF